MLITLGGEMSATITTSVTAALPDAFQMRRHSSQQDLLNAVSALQLLFQSGQRLDDDYRLSTKRPSDQGIDELDGKRMKGSTTSAEDEAARNKSRRCGRCAGCQSTDCGSCKACGDKKKFGGANVKKQACEQRRCVQPVSSPGGKRAQLSPGMTFAPVSLPPPMLSADAHEAAPGMFATDSAPPMPSPPQPAVSKASSRRRFVRCGSCTGCTTPDCGVCRNCVDNPKFGGPGAKKKACIHRPCRSPIHPSTDAASHGFVAAQLPLERPAAAAQVHYELDEYARLHGVVIPPEALAIMGAFNGQ